MCDNRSGVGLDLLSKAILSSKYSLCSFGLKAVYDDRMAAAGGCQTSCQLKDSAALHRRSVFMPDRFFCFSNTSLLVAFLLLLMASMSETSNSSATALSPSAFTSPSPSLSKKDGGGIVESAAPGVSSSSKYQGRSEGASTGQAFSPGRKVESPEKSRSSCNRSCTTQADISCEVSKRSEYCMHRDESARDFPNKPRNLKISHTKVGEDKTYFNITWNAPHDYSYRAVKGYELLVTSFDYYGQPSTLCFFVNLSSTNWKDVRNVHNVVFFVDCWHTTTSRFTKAHVKIFSYPKLKGDHTAKSIDACVYPNSTNGTACTSSPESATQQPHPPVATPWDVKWNPIISAVQQQSSKALIVTVEPVDSPIAYLKVCINDLSSSVCRGDVSQIESPANTFRCSITGLASNQSYFIYVKPFSEDDHALDVWIHKQTPVFLQPWKQGSTTTTTTQTPESTGPTAGPRHEETGVRAEVVVVLVLVVVIAVATVCCLWHRGYLQRLWFLRCCFSQSLIAGPPIKVLQLYLPENQAFQQMAHKHMEFLKDYLRLDAADCSKMRHQQNPDQWLQRISADRRVIVYMSPQLLAQLRSSDNNGNNNCGGDWSGGSGDCRLDLALPNSLSSKCVQFLHRITTAAALKKGRRRRRNPVFVLSGGFPSDEESELFLSQHGSLGALPRHWVSRQGQLADPGPLLTRLSGCHRSFFTASERLNSPRAQELQNAIGRLQFPGDYYVNVVGDPQADHNESAPMLPHSRAYDVTDHMYTSLSAGAGRGGREGQCPHRTDSGFSSSVDHNRCSNPSSEGNSSPGANSGEELMGEEEEVGEEEAERGVYSIMPPYRGPWSVSQMSIQFQAPEPVPGDVDSVVLTENLNRVNERGDSNWN